MQHKGLRVALGRLQVLLGGIYNVYAWYYHVAEEFEAEREKVVFLEREVADRQESERALTYRNEQLEWELQATKMRLEDEAHTPERQMAQARHLLAAAEGRASRAAQRAREAQASRDAMAATLATEQAARGEAQRTIEALKVENACLRARVSALSGPTQTGPEEEHPQPQRAARLTSRFFPASQGEVPAPQPPQQQPHARAVPSSQGPPQQQHSGEPQRGTPQPGTGQHEPAPAPTAVIAPASAPSPPQQPLPAPSAPSTTRGQQQAQADNVDRAVLRMGQSTQAMHIRSTSTPPPFAILSSASYASAASQQTSSKSPRGLTRAVITGAAIAAGLGTVAFRIGFAAVRHLRKSAATSLITPF